MTRALTNHFSPFDNVHVVVPHHSVTSYQTLPRNMPSHGAQLVARYPEGYRTLPRNGVMRPGSVCSVAGSVYDRALRPVSTPAPTSTSTCTSTSVEKRRSMRDDTMWQLYEWQQRQAFSRQSLAPPTGRTPRHSYTLISHSYTLH